MKAVCIALVLFGAVAALASDMKVEVHLNDHGGHEHARFYMNPGDFSCAKVARTPAHDGQLHSKCGFQWSLERKDHEDITVGFHGPKSKLDVSFDLKCSDIIQAASAHGPKTLIHDNLAPGHGSGSHHGGHHHHHHSIHHSAHESLLEFDSDHHDSGSLHSGSISSHSSSSSSQHGIVLSTLKISDEKFLADLAQYCGHDGESSESSSHESSSGESSSDESSSDESSSSSSGSDESSGSSDESSGSDSGSSSDSQSSSGSDSGSQSDSGNLPENSQTASVSASASSTQS